MGVADTTVAGDPNQIRVTGLDDELRARIDKAAEIWAAKVGVVNKRGVRAAFARAMILKAVEDIEKGEKNGEND